MSQMKKIIHIFVLCLGVFLLIYAVYNTVLLIAYPGQNTLTFWNLRGSDHQLSSAAEYFAFAAAGLWVTKTAFIALSQKETAMLDPLKQLFLFFQRHHVLLGWVALVTTSAHGLYYILHRSDRLSMMVTGWVAWSGLIVLAFIGVFFDQRLREKKKTKQIRLYHIGFSVVFMFGFILHVL
jgi:hypothetical protein